MEIRFQLTREDIAACERRLWANPRRLRPWRAKALPAAALFASALAVAALGRTGYPDWRGALLIATAVLFALAALAHGLWRGFAGSGPERRVGGWTLVTTPAGLATASELGADFLPWTAVLALEETPSHFYLHARPDSAIIVPKRAFAE